MQKQAQDVKSKDIIIIDGRIWWVVRTEDLHILEWGSTAKDHPQINKLELLSYNGKDLIVFNAFRGWHEELVVVSSNIERETFYKSVGYIHGR